MVWGVRLLAKTGKQNKQLRKSGRNVERIWLGGLDSNQNSQIQNLESYQLDDLPVGENAGLTSCHGLYLWVKERKLSQFSTQIQK